MSALPDRSNFFSTLQTKLSRKRVAKLYGAIGWEVRKASWYDYEVRGPWAELSIEGDAPILLHGAVSDVLTNAEALLAPLRSADISFKADCYGPGGELLREWVSHDPTTPAPKRRWFLFSLWTLLFAVAIVGGVIGWTAYQMKWIRQRQHAIDSGEVNWVIYGFQSRLLHPPPWSLSIFGQTELSVDALVTAPDATDTELVRLQELFPEHTVRRPNGPNETFPPRQPPQDLTDPLPRNSSRRHAGGGVCP